uniref:ARAD1D41844p n=1 Tax=Blastobotrys adeninivorans TaxID=409370 RepID=A0A060TIX1_BLAAD
MATKAAHKRLAREYKNIQESPIPYIVALPSEENILEWHYVITGPPETPYEGGQYHGTLMFPSDYPFKPPAIRMITPSGRFKTNTRLCLSISDYHPKTWNPACFMVSDETTAGSITTSSSDKVRLAKESHAWNLYQDSRFLKHFPELAEENRKLIADKQAEAKTVSENKTSSAAHKAPISNNTNNANMVTKPNSTSANDSGNKQNRSAQSSMSTTQKILWVCVLLVSWVVASRMFSSSS